MKKETGLQRFIEAQEWTYQTAFSEIKQGRKQSHWMWYIFPQILGLGLSETSRFYAIKDLHEAEQLLAHPVLGGRLIRISKKLLRSTTNDAGEIFGSPDNLKLRSSMTLFAALPNTDPIFTAVLDKFFNGNKDPQTLQLIGKL
jgi:uncharacterized protein (DUF1810 family)